MTLIIVKAAILMTISIVIHELGHFLYFRWFAKRKLVEIRFYYTNRRKFGFKVGYPTDYVNLTKNQKYELYFAGVFVGLIPLLIAFFFNIIYGLLIPLYLVGCGHDLNNIWRLVNGSKISGTKNKAKQGN